MAISLPEREREPSRSLFEHVFSIRCDRRSLIASKLYEYLLFTLLLYVFATPAFDVSGIREV